MSSPPTGTVTFLFTDIEGSTNLAQLHPASWETARQRHHAILRKEFETHQGHVFQTSRDAFCVAFATAPDALAAAVSAQRALQGEAWGETPIKVRMGLHTGGAEARDGTTACTVAPERGPTGRRLSRRNVALCDDAIDTIRVEATLEAPKTFGSSKFTGEAETIGILNAKGDLLKRVGKFARTESEIGGLTLKAERLVKIVPQGEGRRRSSTRCPERSPWDSTRS